MRGFLNDPVIPPSNVPYPPIGIAFVFEPNADSTPANTRSLYCQSALDTWNGK